MDTRTVELVELSLPDFGLPTVEPIVPPETYEARIAEARRRAAAAGYDALLVYGDREHFANLAYLTKYDPRFEEALLILAPGHTPALLVGNEGMAYAAICPAKVDRVLFQTFSLISQPRGNSAPLGTILRNAGIGEGKRIGIAGWKYFSAIESDAPEQWVEAPAYIVDVLRGMGCAVFNATALFMEPEHGLRAINDVDQLASFEYASTLGSQGLRDLIFNVRPGLTEYEVARLMGMNGFPNSCHPLVCSGERTPLGLASPSSRRMQEGDPLFASLSLWGSNNARAGFLV